MEEEKDESTSKATTTSRKDPVKLITLVLPPKPPVLTDKSKILDLWNHLLIILEFIPIQFYFNLQKS